MKDRKPCVSCETTSALTRFTASYPPANSFNKSSEDTRVSPTILRCSLIIQLVSGQSKALKPDQRSVKTNIHLVTRKTVKTNTSLQQTPSCLLFKMHFWTHFSVLEKIKPFQTFMSTSQTELKRVYHHLHDGQTGGFHSTQEVWKPVNPRLGLTSRFTEGSHCNPSCHSVHWQWALFPI